MTPAESFGQYLALCADAHHLRPDTPAPLAALNARGAEALPKLTEQYRRPENIPAACAPDSLFAPDYGVNLAHHNMNASAAEAFRCGVPDLNSILIVVANDVVGPVAGTVPGLSISSLRSIPEQYAVRAAGLLLLHAADNAATALNSLLLSDGIYIHVDPGTVIDKPVQILNISRTDMPMLSPRRIIVDAGANSSVRVLVCDHSSTPSAAHLSSQVIQLHASDGARIELYDIEESGAASNRMWQIYTHQAPASGISVTPASLCGGITNNEYHFDLGGEGASLSLAGLAICSGGRRQSDSVDLRHTAAHTESRQMFKYSLYEQAHTAFTGRVTVAADTPYADASQTVRSLLNSPQARIDTSPQLEIYCDEVKASHGSATGNLDPNALFYMQSRGIPLSEARRMLTQAFMADVVDTIGCEVLRQRLHILVDKRLSGTAADCGTCASACHKASALQ